MRVRQSQSRRCFSIVTAAAVLLLQIGGLKSYGPNVRGWSLNSKKHSDKKENSRFEYGNTNWLEEVISGQSVYHFESFIGRRVCKSVFSVSDGGFSGYHQPSVCRFSRSSFVHSALLPPWRFKSIRMRFSLPDNCALAPLILVNY